ncbi:hypothetical protein PQX77_019249 [Marasmius sp. AFHP31]|nr:hypothetical protein PQX77_019249 [Marasmius sp. AFHP31]
MTIQKSSLMGSTPTNSPFPLATLPASPARAPAPVGALTIGCVVLLENPQYQPGSAKSAIFDARIDLPDGLTVATGKIQAWIESSLPTTPLYAECKIGAFDPRAPLPTWLNYPYEKESYDFMGNVIKASGIFSLVAYLSLVLIVSIHRKMLPIPEVPVPLDVPLLHIAGVTSNGLPAPVNSFDIKAYQWLRIIGGLSNSLIRVQFFENDRYGLRKPIPPNGSIVYVVGKFLSVDVIDNVRTFTVEPEQLSVLFRATSTQAFLSDGPSYDGDGGSGGGGGGSGGGSGHEAGPSTPKRSPFTPLANTSAKTTTPATFSSVSTGASSSSSGPKAQEFLEDYPEVRPDLLKRKQPDDLSFESPTPAPRTRTSARAGTTARGRGGRARGANVTSTTGRGRGRGRARGGVSTSMSRGGGSSSNAARGAKQPALSEKAKGKQKASDDFIIINSRASSPLTDIEMEGTNDDIFADENEAPVVDDEAEEDNNICEDED